MQSFMFLPRSVPSVLQEFLGERTTALDTAMALGTGIFFPILLALLFPSDWTAMKAWQKILFSVTACDIAAGAVANTSPGTERYYYSKSAAIRHIFVSIHFLHLAGVGFPLGFSEVWAFLAQTYGLMLVSAVAVLNAGRAQRQVALASLTFVLPLLFTLDCGKEILRPVATVFVIKLVLSFSVEHQRPVPFEDVIVQE